MLIQKILDFLLPRYCEMCSQILDTDENVLCKRCNAELPRTLMWQKNKKQGNKYSPDDNVFCEVDNTEEGYVIPDYHYANSDDGDGIFQDNILARKYWGRVKIERAVSFLKYYPRTRTADLVYSFKYHNKSYIARYFGRMIGKELLDTGFFDEIDYLVPTPLTFLREFHRGYNQCRILAEGISKETGIEISTCVLKRNNFKSSQTKLDAIGRQNNIKDVFYLSKKADLYINKHILLVDDIITTGSTTMECCQVLQQIRGIKISVLSLGLVTPF